MSKKHKPRPAQRCPLNEAVARSVIPSAYEDIVPPPLPKQYRKRSFGKRMWEWLVDKLNPHMR